MTPALLWITLTGKTSNIVENPMGQQFNALSGKHIRFITEQKLFFVGTAAADSRVNVSPKGMDSLRVLDNGRVAWLNVTGSGNETAAHVQQDPRMTLMFCAFDGDPLILRLYGAARVIHKNDPKWNALFPLFKPLPGARQIFDMTIELVQTSCGMGVPFYTYAGERQLLHDWATRKGEEGLQRYWEEKNQMSIDGIPTHIVPKNGPDT
ncbi:MAG: pyridoxamine 5'-phosphate oxidase family protein [Granulosicoccaceae bacterium]